MCICPGSPYHRTRSDRGQMGLFESVVLVIVQFKTHTQKDLSMDKDNPDFMTWIYVKLPLQHQESPKNDSPQ
ncbi:hypothetical protein PROFUN_06694 [Planoprotostelium fungivorum]|uniref:Uncharacterized protein n=1 Tax=Planoprotostelium fungivorum TaxID=1890364 RepID=A0A2P6NG27_9EUKA|nr:hypothetical protein PROFUN_06694 [Planoprotostelium fungivorum]